MKRKKIDYGGLILRAKGLAQHRIVIGIPTTGNVRYEWVAARYGQVIPCNWGHVECHQWINSLSPIGYAVAEARNLIIHKFIVNSKAEWLFFIDHDVILPPDCFIKINQYMLNESHPVVSGLYFAKAHPPEPLIYRGRGNGYFAKWKRGDKVWVDGVPFGCTLIHRSLLEPMWNDAEDYVVEGTTKIRKVIDTPSGINMDPEKGFVGLYSGTEDLAWCNRVIAGGYLKKTLWPDYAKKQYPFLVDTSIWCGHIDTAGTVYPLTVAQA